MDSSLIISKLDSAFLGIFSKDSIPVNEIRLGVAIRPGGDNENQLNVDLFHGEKKIRPIDISTEILGLKRTKSQLAQLTPMGRAFFDLHNSTQKLEGFLAMGIYNKCVANNYDFLNSTFFVSKPNQTFIGKLIDGEKIKEITLDEIFSMEALIG